MIYELLRHDFRRRVIRYSPLYEFSPPPSQLGPTSLQVEKRFSLRNGLGGFTF